MLDCVIVFFLYLFVVLLYFLEVVVVIGVFDCGGSFLFVFFGCYRVREIGFFYY